MRKGHSIMARFFAGLMSMAIAFTCLAPTSFAEEAAVDNNVAVEQPAETAPEAAEANTAAPEEATEATTAAKEEATEATTAAKEEATEATEATTAAKEEATEEATTATTEETTEAEKVTEAMTATTIGGVSYYYTDTAGDAEGTVYQVTVTTGRGPSAKTTTTDYSKSDLTVVTGTDYAYIVAPGATALSGTLYGYGTGTATNYKEVYTNLGANTEGTYDVISSASKFTSFHAKDISSTVTFGTDADGNKAITGLLLDRAAKTVDATAYVEASILKAAGAELTEDQQAALDITLKANPATAPAEGTVKTALSSASFTTSRYGKAEFDIVPDDTVAGYVWSEYWTNMYAATISDGTTTVGAVHWIDMYGESATSGAHYNKVQIALNNGESVGANKANVDRYAAFFDANTGNVKPGTYTITLYSEGYEPLKATVTIPDESMTSTSIGGVTYYYANTADDDASTVYQVSVTAGRGPSAVTTVYNYTKSDLTAVAGTDYAYIAAPGATALSGTLYGYGEGTATNYKEVYTKLGASTEGTYDVISSATAISSYHSKDISSTVKYGTDADGKKAITGLLIERKVKTVEATAYVEANILKAAGADLTEDQQAALDITLKANPMTAPSESKIQPKAASATFVTSSNYGKAEFDIVPDDTVEGYVWSEYWDNMYAATISDGTTTVGAVHWIDMYGEAATSGYHYNKVQIALNNGTSKASNKADVDRYAAFFDANTGNVKPGTYTITLYSDGYEPLVANVTIPAESMASTAIGGVTYYYADTTGDDATTVYQVSVTAGRGPSAKTTVYNYTKSDLTAVTGTDYVYIAAPGSTALSGTLYGYGEGTATNYKKLYKELGVKTDKTYDVISSATAFTSYHAKDISSTVTYGTDYQKKKAIVGLNIKREQKTVDAVAYVEASILKAAGASLSAEQTALLAVTLKKNPMVAPSTKEIQPKVSKVTFTTSSFGKTEFDIIPDDTVEGFVWSEYWDNVYAATISDGITTVGAVHWIDMYGEEATSGYHYNKLQIALNNGTSKGSNKADVDRFAAFYDADGNLKSGNYTITIYADGYKPMTTTIGVGMDLKDKTVVYSGQAAKIDAATAYNVTGTFTYKYYSDSECKKEITTPIVNAGTYFVKAVNSEMGVVSNVARLTIKKADQTLTLKTATKSYKKKSLKKKSKSFYIGATGNQGTLTYKSSNKKIKVSKDGKVTVKKGIKKGTYKVVVTAAATDNYNAVSKTVKIKVK